MRPSRLLLFVPLVFVPCAAWPQGNPVGPEFRVNTYTAGNQGICSVARGPSGNFVVVWISPGLDGSGYGVFGQRYMDSGMPLGPEFRVNTYTTNAQQSPSIAIDASGNFVVVWESLAQDGSYWGVFGQRYASSGAPLGTEFRVNTVTTNIQRLPAVASHASGDFVVAWSSFAEDGEGYDVFGQRYASSGVPLASKFRVNTYTTSSQAGGVVAIDSLGDFVVVWSSYGQDGSNRGVFAQRYANTGAPLGPEFRVNTYTTDIQAFPSLASDSLGNFVVIWSSYYQDGSGSGILGQRYASSGVALGPEFRLNTYTTNHQGRASVATDSTGDFVVVWSSYEQDGSGSGIFGQRYGNGGATLGPEFRVNTYATNDQRRAAAAADSAGNFVVVWMSQGQDGSYDGVFGQRYSQIVPVELMHFRVE